MSSCYHHAPPNQSFSISTFQHTQISGPKFGILREELLTFIFILWGKVKTIFSDGIWGVVVTHTEALKGIFLFIDKKKKQPRVFVGRFSKFFFSCFHAWRKYFLGVNETMIMSFLSLLITNNIILLINNIIVLVETKELFRNVSDERFLF